MAAARAHGPTAGDAESDRGADRRMRQRRPVEVAGLTAAATEHRLRSLEVDAQVRDVQAGEDAPRGVPQGEDPPAAECLLEPREPGPAVPVRAGAPPAERVTGTGTQALAPHGLGTQTVLSGGSCQPGDFYGPPLMRPPVSSAIGLGVAGRGTVCPRSGHAKGLSALEISQIDDLSGGQTRTQVPMIERTTPLDGEVLYGGFTAIARSGLPGPHGSTFATGTPVALTIESAGSTHAIFHAGNVDTPGGVPVQALSRGAYVAMWVLTDANGDTRTIRTEFVEG